MSDAAKRKALQGDAGVGTMHPPLRISAGVTKHAPDIRDHPDRSLEC
jgi:hypothetical protein